MLTWTLLHPNITSAALGYLPDMLDDRDPRPAREQFDEAYRQYGGWRPNKDFILMRNNALVYPGDPPIKPIAQVQLRDELIALYPGDWVAIIQPDRTFEVSRMD